MVTGLTTLERLMGSCRLYWAIWTGTRWSAQMICFRTYMLSWGSQTSTFGSVVPLTIFYKFWYKMHKLHLTTNKISYTVIVSTNRYLDHLRLLEEKMWGKIDRGVHLQLIKEQAQIAIRKVFILRVTVGFERLCQQSIQILLHTQFQQAQFEEC